MIVAGGVTCYDPGTMTSLRAVEMLHIIIMEHGWFTKSYWSVVEQLPLVVFEAVPLIVNDILYFAEGYDTNSPSTSNIITAHASLPELLQRSNKNTSSTEMSRVWNKLPDIPYSSFSI